MERQITLPEGLLNSIYEFIDDYSDVKDGDDGRPEANEAMSLIQQLDEYMPKLAA